MLLYHPVTGAAKNVPAIDAPAWITIHGYRNTPPQEAPPAPVTSMPAPNVKVPPPPLPLLEMKPTVEVSAETALLALINSAEKSYELVPIPTVGHAAARAIIANRPEGGYESLDDLAPILPHKTSLEAIKGWVPSHE